MQTFDETRLLACIASVSNRVITRKLELLPQLSRRTSRGNACYAGYSLAEKVTLEYHRNPKIMCCVLLTSNAIRFHPPPSSLTPLFTNKRQKSTPINNQYLITFIITGMTHSRAWYGLGRMLKTRHLKTHSPLGILPQTCFEASRPVFNLPIFSSCLMVNCMAWKMKEMKESTPFWQQCDLDSGFDLYWFWWVVSI